MKSLFYKKVAFFFDEKVTFFSLLCVHSLFNKRTTRKTTDSKHIIFNKNTNIMHITFALILICFFPFAVLSQTGAVEPKVVPGSEGNGEPIITIHHTENAEPKTQLQKLKESLGNNKTYEQFDFLVRRIEEISLKNTQEINNINSRIAKQEQKNLEIEKDQKVVINLLETLDSQVSLLRKEIVVLNEKVDTLCAKLDAVLSKKDVSIWHSLIWGTVALVFAYVISKK